MGVVRERKNHFEKKAIQIYPGHVRGCAPISQCHPNL